VEKVFRVSGTLARNAGTHVQHEIGIAIGIGIEIRIDYEYDNDNEGCGPKHIRFEPRQ